MEQKQHSADSRMGTAFPVALIGETTILEQRFHALAWATADAVWIINSDGVVQEESPTWRAFTGQPIKRHVQWAWLKVFYPDDQKPFQETCIQAIHARQPYQTECRLLGHDGVYRTCSVRLVPVRGSDGSIDEWMGIARDMTEQRLAEAKHTQELEREHEARLALETAKAHLQAVLDVLPVGVCIADADGRLVQINAAARATWGENMPYATSTEGYHVYRGWWTRTGQPIAPEEWGMARALQRGEVSIGEEVDIESFDGRRKTMLHYAVPVRDAVGVIIGGVVAILDITERKRLEQIERQVVAEKETRLALLQLILDELPGSVYLVRGHDARLVLANRAAASVWRASWPQGQPMLEFLRQNGIRIFGIDGRPLAPDQFATLRAVQHGETVRQFEEIIRHPDGSALPVMVNAVAIDAYQLTTSLAQAQDSPSQGESEYIAIVMHQDVTALKEAEKLKDEFIGIAAHELRNPLAVLRGYAQMLLMQPKRGRGPDLNDWQVEALQSVDRSTTRLVELTEDLLDVTRLQGGGLQLHPEPTDLVALTQRIVKRLQITTAQHTISIATLLPHVVVHVDPGRIEQVLSNLIGNAIKYSPQGGPIEISISEEVELQEACLSIRDAGIGIPVKEQAHIFRRFVRASNSSNYGITGTGLGLYLCRELVERHDGRVWFESSEGHGSTFFIALPLFLESAGYE